MVQYFLGKGRFTFAEICTCSLPLSRSEKKIRVTLAGRLWMLPNSTLFSAMPFSFSFFFFLSVDLIETVKPDIQF